MNVIYDTGRPGADGRPLPSYNVVLQDLTPA
jgi:hypothetical protein